MKQTFRATFRLSRQWADPKLALKPIVDGLGDCCRVSFTPRGDYFVLADIEIDADEFIPARSGSSGLGLDAFLSILLEPVWTELALCGVVALQVSHYVDQILGRARRYSIV